MRYLLALSMLISIVGFAQEREKLKWVLIQVTMSNGKNLETYENQYGERVTVPALPHDARPRFQDEIIRIALQDATKDVSQTPDGTTIIKTRKEKSENPTDPAEFTNQNMQRIFNWGFGLGETVLHVSPEAQQRIKEGDTSQMFVDISAGIRLPFPILKRFMFGGSYTARNALRGPSESITWATPAPGDDDGLTTYPLASDSYKTIFAEYDILLFPGNDAKFALSAGVWKGFSKYTGDHAFNYSEQGVSAKVRFFAGSGQFDNGTIWELAPFFAFRHGDKKMSAFYAGLGFSFGPEMKKKKKVQK